MPRHDSARPKRRREQATLVSDWLRLATGSWPGGDPVGIRLITRRGHDWSARYPLVVEAVNHLKVRSCLIDGEVVCCNERGLATFQLLGHRRNESRAFLYATCWS
jgi:hypothetical protein